MPKRKGEILGHPRKISRSSAEQTRRILIDEKSLFAFMSTLPLELSEAYLSFLRYFVEKGELKIIFSIPRAFTPSKASESDFHYLAQKNKITISSQYIGELVKRGEIIKKRKVMHAISPSDALTVDGNGFEVKQLPTSLTNRLIEYRETESDEKRKQLREQIRAQLNQILTEYYPGYEAVSVDTVYRNTDSSKKNAFGSVPLVHCDFDKTDLPHLLDVFKKEWGTRVKASGYEYKASNVAFMRNVWMPLSPYVSADPLAMYDCKQTEVKTHPYEAVRRGEDTFTAMSMTTESEQTSHWYYVPNMSVGSCYLFDSWDSPHSAAKVPHQEDAKMSTRESIEVRLMFFKKHTEEPQKNREKRMSDVEKSGTYQKPNISG